MTLLILRCLNINSGGSGLCSDLHCPHHQAGSCMCPRSWSCGWAQGNTLPAHAPQGRPPDVPPPEEHRRISSIWKVCSLSFFPFLNIWQTFLWISISSLLTGFVQTEPESWGIVKNLSFFRSTVAFRDNLCMYRGKKKHLKFTQLSAHSIRCARY